MNIDINPELALTHNDNIVVSADTGVAASKMAIAKGIASVVRRDASKKLAAALRVFEKRLASLNFIACAELVEDPYEVAEEIAAEAERVKREIETAIDTFSAALDRLTDHGPACEQPPTQFLVFAAILEEADYELHLDPTAYAVILEATTTEDARECARRFALDQARERSAWLNEADGLPFDAAQRLLASNGLYVGEPHVAPLATVKRIAGHDATATEPCGVTSAPATAAHQRHDHEVIGSGSPSCSPGAMQPPASAAQPVFIPPVLSPMASATAQLSPTESLLVSAPRAVPCPAAQPVFTAPAMTGATTSAVYEPRASPTSKTGVPRPAFPPAIAEAARLWNVPVTAAQAGAEDA